MIQVIKILLTGFLLLMVSNVGARSALQGDEKSWHFQVFLDDEPIGYHRFTLRTQDDTQRLFIEARFEVEFLFMTVYDYLHENRETWQGGCLQRLESTTLDNGEQQYVSLYRRDQLTRIETGSGSRETEYCVRSFAYWNPDLLQTGQFLNAQNGELMDIRFRHMGQEQLSIDSRTIDGDRYRIEGEQLEIDLWYDRNRQWLALQSRTSGGRLLRYQLDAETLP